MSEKIPPVGTGYSLDTVLPMKSFQSIRGVKDYVTKMGFKDNPDFLLHLPPDSMVLDLGSGKGFLAKELFVLRPDLTTISINPALAQKDFALEQKLEFLTSKKITTGVNPEPWGIAVFTPITTIKAQVKHDKFAVAAINPRLPFKNETFEVVLDAMASLYYGWDEEAKTTEIVRVLKPRGFAAIGPVDRNGRTEMLEKHLSAFPGLSFAEKFVYINEDDRQKGRQSTVFHIKKA